jgi:hypothetical protein
MVRSIPSGGTSNVILSASGIPISATTVQRLTYDERNTEEMKKQMEDCDEKLRRVFEFNRQ